MCSDIGNKKKTSEPTKPNYSEMAMMGVAKDQCGNCDLYIWYQMLGEWQALDGRCPVKIALGPVRADTRKCDYFVPRSKL